VGKRIHRSAAPALLLRNEAVFQSRLVTASAVFAIFFLLLAQKKEIKKRAGEIPACRQAGMRRLNSVEQVLCRFRHSRPNAREHFQLIIMQGDVIASTEHSMPSG